MAIGGDGAAVSGSASSAGSRAEPEPEPRKRPARRIRLRLARVIDYAYFLLATLAAIWLAWLLASESLSWGWWLILFFVLFWGLLAYLVLPRLHSILTRIYVPNYFIGRARTSDGLLGDPINLAVLGSQSQLMTAMADAAWTRADPVTARSSWRIVTATLLRRSYDEAPVSPLLLFGRQQDLAYQQEVKGNPAKRHHVRFWKCPDDWRLPGGERADWLGAATFDRSVGFSLFTLQITHKIDANTDIERDHVVHSVTRSDASAAVSVIKDFSTGYHSRNGGGDSIVTDGDLPVVDLRTTAAGPEFERTVDVVKAAADRRPLSITLGAALLALRAVAGAVFVVGTALHWGAFVRSLTVEIDGVPRSVIDDIVSSVAVTTVVVIAVGLLVQAALITLIYRGSNWARIVSMTLSAIAVIAAAVDFFNGGTQVNLRANLLGLPLDIPRAAGAVVRECERLDEAHPLPARRAPQREALGVAHVVTQLLVEERSRSALAATPSCTVRWTGDQASRPLAFAFDTSMLTPCIIAAPYGAIVRTSQVGTT
ncbi:LssY C-terminal domain-containing protein [Humibacter ginsenosidimutans]|uniref:LssY C-terminal domain-containing protein n=1 Tax=Humibacter ginsenosidimutans TaxID=2599293 RepID=UPI001FEE9B27|nr:LssY C-terminal domain-containing protein [Humibacter ginsenosidimutans]